MLDINSLNIKNYCLFIHCLYKFEPDLDFHGKKFFADNFVRNYILVNFNQVEFDNLIKLGFLLKKMGIDSPEFWAMVS